MAYNRHPQVSGIKYPIETKLSALYTFVMMDQNDF